jgi:hypothetical protein
MEASKKPQTHKQAATRTHGQAKATRTMLLPMRLDGSSDAEFQLLDAGMDRRRQVGQEGFVLQLGVGIGARQAHA